MYIRTCNDKENSVSLTRKTGEEAKKLEDLSKKPILAESNMQSAALQNEAEFGESADEALVRAKRGFQQMSLTGFTLKLTPC